VTELGFVGAYVAVGPTAKRLRSDGRTGIDLPKRFNPRHWHEDVDVDAVVVENIEPRLDVRQCGLAIV
jgi:hypothetical protein